MGAAASSPGEAAGKGRPPRPGVPGDAGDATSSNVSGEAATGEHVIWGGGDSRGQNSCFGSDSSELTAPDAPIVTARLSESSSSGEANTNARGDTKEAANAAGEGEGAPPTLWSMGSADHGNGQCTPCLWMHRESGCNSGSLCEFCHTCTKDDAREWRRIKQARARQSARESRREALAESQAAAQVQQQAGQQQQQRPQQRQGTQPAAYAAQQQQQQQQMQMQMQMQQQQQQQQHQVLWEGQVRQRYNQQDMYHQQDMQELQHYRQQQQQQQQQQQVGHQPPAWPGGVTRMNL